MQRGDSSEKVVLKDRYPISEKVSSARKYEGKGFRKKEKGVLKRRALLSIKGSFA